MTLDEISRKLVGVELQDQWGNVYKVRKLDNAISDLCPIRVDVVSINDRKTRISYDDEPDSTLEYWPSSYIWMFEYAAYRGSQNAQGLKVVSVDNLKPINPDINIDEALIALTDMLPHNETSKSWLEAHLQTKKITVEDLEELALINRKYAMWWNRYQKYHKSKEIEGSEKSE